MTESADTRTPRTVPVPQPKGGDRYDGFNGSQEPCLICGRELKRPAKHWVHLIEGGASLLHVDDGDLPIDEAADMYWFPVGPECAKLVPKGFLSDGIGS